MGRNDLQKLLDEKKMMKEKVFLKFWPKMSAQMPLLIIYADAGHEKILLQILEGLLVLSMQVVIVCESSFPDFTSQHKNTFVWLNPKSNSKIQVDHWLLASDISLIFNEGRVNIKEIFQKGVIPVGFAQFSHLQNYQPNTETGNSFIFKDLNVWDIFSALVRATETYRFPYDWQHIIRGVLEVR